MTSRSYNDNPLPGLILLALTLAAVYFGFKFFDSHDWAEASGKVLEASVYQSGDQDDFDRYSLSIKYVYVADDVSYTGEDTVRRFRYRSEAETYRDKEYWKNQKIRVLYNQTFPNLSTLRKGYTLFTNSQ